MTKHHDPVIDRLFAAKNAADADAFAACFADQAIVEDEGLTHVGPAAIREWVAGNNRKYKLTTTVTGIDQKDEAAVVRADVSGDFPGSPLPFRYDLTVVEGRITRLKPSLAR